MTRRVPRPNRKLQCLQEISEYPLLSALMGRRSRRFAAGARIPSGSFAYTSKREVQPLDEFEKLLIVTALAGNTGWSHLIPYNQKYAPKMPNYAGSAAGRVFPSAAGFHTTDLFFTDDSGVYFLSTRDSKPSEHNLMAADCDVDEWIQHHESLIRKISSERLQIPREEPHMESHNLWVSNTPGSLLAIPVVDLAQHFILGLCYLVQNGYGITDDINKKQIPGLEKFGHLINLKELYPLSFLDQLVLGEATVEVSTSCFSGALMLQAMGLGGWMYDGINPLSILGVTGDPRNKGLGFRADTNPAWNFPNATGLSGVFESTCPPHYKDIKTAVDAVVRRKYGDGGPFDNNLSGPWKESSNVRGSAAPHSEEFKECVTLMTQYVFDQFGKLPATVPSVYCLTYLQAFHLDTDFYDRFYEDGAYLETHAHHHERWHSN